MVVAVVAIIIVYYLYHDDHSLSQIHLLSLQNKFAPETVKV